MPAQYANWSDVKAKARAVDPRTEAERVAGAEAARERREAHVRGHQLAAKPQRSRSLQEIIDHADELADQFGAYDPPAGGGDS